MAARPIPVNATAAAILGLLHDGPLTGGELVAAAGERFGGFFSVTRSQVYRELPALAEAGLLRLGKLGPRASQQYRINAAGKRSFRAWLAGPGGADALRSPLVLRLLYAGALPEDDRAKLVATSRAAYTERLKEAQEHVGRRPRALTSGRSRSSPSRTSRPCSRCSTTSDRHPDRAGGHRVAWSVVNADAAADIKELSSTLESIEAVSDLPALRTEIADLEDQAGQPDLWNDQEAAQKVTSRLAHAQGRAPAHRGPAAPARRPARALRAGRGRGRRVRGGRRRRRSRQAARGDRRAGGPHPAVRRVRRARGAGHHPLRGRRGRRRRLRRDAACGCTCAGRSGTATPPTSTTPPTPRRRASSRRPSRSTPRSPTARSRSSRAPTGWCASRRSTTRAAARPRSPGVEVRAGRRDHRPHRHRREGPARRRLPLVGPRRPGRQHHRLRGADHPPAHRHRRLLPERALARSRTGRRR